ncbi:hypothetical protein [Aureimonas pseudogalii]|uniref:Putative secreted protein n=1 Tax=Aureimonas pseudogalii TaxID=1744844 RepID=A0A7W6H867_9HYPH|nr:hypothetical protein [Aureimonas pseudogalii]MBB4000366.1 putative secreted protein [Aureimonas pseudogalii]
MRTTAFVLSLALGLPVAAPAFAQEAAPPATTLPALASPEAPTGAAPSATPTGKQTAPATPSADTAERNAEVLSAIANLAPMIGDVQIVGPWTDTDRHGVWRTIMTQTTGEATGSRFFVQQLEEKDGRASVASSTEVTEIAAIDGAIVGYRADPPAEGQESSLTLFFDVVPSDGEVAQTYELFVSPNEPYRFGPATN